MTINIEYSQSFSLEGTTKKKELGDICVCL